MTYIRPLGNTFDAGGTLVTGTAAGGGYSIGDFLGAVLNKAKGMDAATAADVPSASGGTSISASDFNSTARPGVCKATNITALNYVKTLQRQLNRVAHVKGLGKITADGEVGAATLALFAKVQGFAGAALMGSPSSCMGIAPDADVLSAQVQAYADSIGAPASTSAALGIKAPTIIKPNGQEVAEAGIMDAFGAMPTLEQLAVVGVLGGIGYMLLTGKRKAKR